MAQFGWALNANTNNLQPLLVALVGVLHVGGWTRRSPLALALALRAEVTAWGIGSPPWQQHSHQRLSTAVSAQTFEIAVLSREVQLLSYLFDCV